MVVVVEGIISGPPTTALGDGSKVGLLPRLGDPCVTCIITVVACSPPRGLALMRMGLEIGTMR